jgi:A/G-specific adenine glycosylase
MATSRLPRASAINAARRISTQIQEDHGIDVETKEPRLRAKRQLSPSVSLASSDESSAVDTASSSESEPAPKRRNVAARLKGRVTAKFSSAALLDATSATHGSDRALTSPPPRIHSSTYHRPLLLSDASGRRSLLSWFDGQASSRGMPWRKPWIDPRSPEFKTPKVLRDALEQRAYEVWISEIMLQQTRVATVIAYWTSWMERWPTIHDLAAASQDEVLGAWRGLGYYSRARRIHEAAQLVANDGEMQGLLPSDVAKLQKAIPGVGRYTAGAIASIVFGKAVAVVDGNVLRVLSRQLGLLGDVKGDKQVIDFLWTTAESLVRSATLDGDQADGTGELPPSDQPGRWNQALMELGSTVCTPKPDCNACPISSTCRAYAEGAALSQRQPTERPTDLQDVEDLCGLCSPIDLTSTSLGEDVDEEEQLQSPRKKSSISSFFDAPPRKGRKRAIKSGQSDSIAAYCQKFPLRKAKKTLREEETLVCALRRDDGKYLIQKRPEKGLLAGLWELPSCPAQDMTAFASREAREATAVAFARDILGGKEKTAKSLATKSDRELGCVPWVFSHLKLAMHVQLIELQPQASDLPSTPTRRWVSAEELDAEAMGTGMRKCWEMVKTARP